MASFSDSAFFTDAFSVDAFDFGSGPPPAPPVTPTPFPIGGGIPRPGKPSKEDVSRARRRLGLEDEEYRREAHRIALEVAARQAQRLELDKQKQYDELSRELRLTNIELEGSYLEILNAERERLIEAEISARLKAKLRQQTREEEDIMALLMMIANM